MRKSFSWPFLILNQYDIQSAKESVETYVIYIQNYFRYYVISKTIRIKAFCVIILNRNWFSFHLKVKNYRHFHSYMLFLYLKVRKDDAVKVEKQCFYWINTNLENSFLWFLVILLDNPSSKDTNALKIVRSLSWIF